MITIESSELQTKKWRKEQEWYVNGKSNECEIYQRNLLENIMKCKIQKSKYRFNMENNSFEQVTCPNTKSNGFEYTEDMDGSCEIGGTKYYFNLKMVCDDGGAQTRTLRETYHFIIAQCEWMLEKKPDMVFINILDGDTSYKHKDKFRYLINESRNKKFVSLHDKIFVGDLLEFESWWKENYLDEEALLAALEDK